MCTNLDKLHCIVEVCVKSAVGLLGCVKSTNHVLHCSVLDVIICMQFAVSALTLIFGQQEWHLAYKNTDCWYFGNGDLTGALHALPFW